MSGLQNFIFNLLLSVVMILTIVDNIMIINYLLIFMIPLFDQHQVLWWIRWYLIYVRIYRYLMIINILFLFIISYCILRQKACFCRWFFFQFLRVLFNLIIFYFFKKYKQEFSFFHWVYLTGTYSCPVVH